MNVAQKNKKMNARGFSLLELLVVITIVSTLLALAVSFGKSWIDQYKSESQIRTMHTELLQARAKAMGKNKQYFVTVNSGNYQVIEDTNENGAIDAAPADAHQTLTTLNYPVSSVTPMLIILDARGIVSDPANPTMSASPPGAPSIIRFNTQGTSPAIDCIVLSPTRINVGKWGTTCDPR